MTQTNVGANSKESGVRYKNFKGKSLRYDDSANIPPQQFEIAAAFNMVQLLNNVVQLATDLYFSPAVYTAVIQMVRYIDHMICWFQFTTFLKNRV